MGRLTLNVLLSFAQFEREVIGERIRDKIAASKRKGMWMGGVPPFGYRAQDRKLVIIDSEAELVRSIFRRWNLARQRYSRRSAPCTARYPSLLTALHLPGPHTRAKSRLLAVGGQNPARRGLSAGGRRIRTISPAKLAIGALDA